MLALLMLLTRCLSTSADALLVPSHDVHAHAGMAQHPTSADALLVPCMLCVLTQAWHSTQLGVVVTGGRDGRLILFEVHNAAEASTIICSSAHTWRPAELPACLPAIQGRCVLHRAAFSCLYKPACLTQPVAFTARCSLVCIEQRARLGHFRWLLWIVYFC